MELKRRNVCIIGAGFAGLSAYLSLLDSRYNLNIKIFDKDECFEYTPSIPSCVSRPEYCSKIRLSLRKVCGPDFINEKVIKADKNRVYTEKAKYSFDFLIIASGSLPNFFKNKGFERHALPIKRVEDILRINARLDNSKDIVVIGGGYTGVEIASVFSELPGKKVIIVHPSKSLLQNLDEKAGAAALSWLRMNNVEVLLGKKAVKCLEKSVVLESGEVIKSDLTIITAGIMPNNPFFMPASINPDFSLASQSNIFLIGDASSSPALKTAHNAMLQGRGAAKVILARIRGRKYEPSLSSWNLLAVSLGKNNGIICSDNLSFYVPFTGFLKNIIEKRVFYEFKYKVKLPL